jgi:hypothetical protein
MRLYLSYKHSLSVSPLNKAFALSLLMIVKRMSSNFFTFYFLVMRIMKELRLKILVDEARGKITTKNMMDGVQLLDYQRIL